MGTGPEKPLYESWRRVISDELEREIGKGPVNWLPPTHISLMLGRVRPISIGNQYLCITKEIEFILLKNNSIKMKRNNETRISVQEQIKNRNSNNKSNNNQILT